jgi:hypothetical protein
MYKRDRVAEFLKGYPGTRTMDEIFSIVAAGFGESVGEQTVRKAVRKIAEKSGSKRWTTWTIYPPNGIPLYPSDQEKEIINSGLVDCCDGMCCPAIESCVK